MNKQGVVFGVFSAINDDAIRERDQGQQIFVDLEVYFSRLVMK
jgi:hypothetical protein